MKKKSILNVCCDVDSCVHNLDGFACKKNGIKITKDIENETAHYCESYEKKCGFRIE